MKVKFVNTKTLEIMAETEMEEVALCTFFDHFYYGDNKIIVTRYKNAEEEEDE